MSLARMPFVLVIALFWKLPPSAQAIHIDAYGACLLMDMLEAEQ